MNADPEIRATASLSKNAASIKKEREDIPFLVSECMTEAEVQFTGTFSGPSVYLLAVVKP